MQANIDFFVADSVKHALPSLAAEGGNDDPACRAPLSETEYLRLCRAFHRFEMAARWFNHARRAPYNQDCWRRAYLRIHNPWENEQVVCVYEHLYRRLGPGLQPPRSEREGRESTDERQCSRKSQHTMSKRGLRASSSRAVPTRPTARGKSAWFVSPI